MVRLKEKMEKLPQNITNTFYLFLRLILSLCVSFLMARCAVTEGFSPFSLILFSVSPQIGLIPTGCYLGAAAGYLTASFTLSTFKYITALTLIYTVYIIFDKIFAEKQTDLAVICGASCFFSGIIFDAFQGITLLSVLLLLGESVLICCCIYFSAYAIRGLKKSAGLNARELIAAAITLILVLLSFQSFNVFQINVSRTAGILILLLGLYSLKISHAAVLGCMIAAVLAVTGHNNEAVFTGVIVANLVGCVFTNFSFPLSLASFILAYDGILLLYGNFPWRYGLFAEPLAAAILLILLPKRKIRRVIEQYLPTRSKESAKSERPRTLKEACFIDCKENCSKAGLCYIKNSDRLESLLESAEEIYISNNDFSVLEEKMKFCAKPEQMIDNIRKQLLSGSSEAFDKMAEQLNKIAERMEERMNSAEKPLHFFCEEETEIRKQLENRGVTLSSLDFYTDHFERKVCLLAGQIEPDLNKKRILCEVLSPFFEGRYHAKISNDHEKLQAQFTETARYRIQCNALCRTKKGELISGDHAIGFYVGKNNYYFILADGMGSGENAATQSVLMVDTLRKLISGGMEVPAALSVYRSLMRFRGNDSFTTVDVCRIDLETGETEFFKAGAFDSYRLHDHELSLLRGGGIPLGLCEKDHLRRFRIRIENNDCLIMATDGLSALGSLTAAAVLDCADENPRAFAEKVLKKLMDSEGDSDDVTVMVCKITESAE